MDISNLPPGIFKTLLDLWNVFCNTFSTIFSWFGETTFGGDGTVLSVMVGAGLGAVLAYWIVKFLFP